MGTRASAYVWWYLHSTLQCCSCPFSSSFSFQLGVKHLVIFINKCDIVEDKEMIELVSAGAGQTVYFGHIAYTYMYVLLLPQCTCTVLPKALWHVTLSKLIWHSLTHFYTLSGSLSLTRTQSLFSPPWCMVVAFIPRPLAGGAHFTSPAQLDSTYTPFVVHCVLCCCFPFYVGTFIKK